MNTGNIVADIDVKIAKLQHAREVLLALDESPKSEIVHNPRRGRPRATSKTVRAVPSALASKSLKATKRTRTRSPEARKRMAEGQKRRWAEFRKKTVG